ncbi:hypothetical protein M3Y99_01984400 [Aphelenchoides fujianensis]|nr:hypothetical protein M3Y99_01984400 [Aphelenchoides fujianensis]
MKRPVREVCNHLEVMCELSVMEVNSLPMAQIGQLSSSSLARYIYKRVGDWTEKVPLFLGSTCQVMHLDDHGAFNSHTMLKLLTAAGANFGHEPP